MSREKILIRTSWISTIGNAVLSVSKIIVGLLAGSLAVLGDGIDSASMCSAMKKRRVLQRRFCRS